VLQADGVPSVPVEDFAVPFPYNDSVSWSAVGNQLALQPCICRMNGFKEIA
jgi:hypothetical protein